MRLSPFFLWGAYAGYTIGNSANLATRSYSYNNRLQPLDQSTQIILWKALDLGYTFGSTTNNGNLMGLTENVYPLGASTGTPANSFPATYTYDDVNRLSTATESASGGWYEDFNYDQFGNMWVSSSSSNLSISGTTPTTSSFYNTANNHFTAVNYDNAGNQTSKLYPTTSTFAYDAESRQNSTYSNTNGTSTYAYSGDGHRVTKVALGATITYVYDALGRLAAEYSTAEGVPDCTTCYIVDDHLGDTRLVLDESANVVSRHDYQPFGAEVPDVNGRTSLWGATDAVNQKFTAKERDLETTLALDYFGARYYGSAIGRFTSVDPAFESESVENPQSWNRYAYVYNRPLTLTDPDGRCPQCLPALAVGAAGGVIAGGATAFAEWYKTGDFSWRDVGAAAAGGFVSGFAATATLGLSALAEAGVGTTVLVGAGSNVVGGVFERTLDSPSANTDVFDPAAMGSDAFMGGAGAAIGELSGQLIRRDFSPLRPPIRKWGTRAYTRAFQTYQRQQTVVNQTARATNVGLGAVISNAFWRMMDSLMSLSPSPAPPPPPKPDVHSVFKPCAQGDPNCGGQ